MPVRTALLEAVPGTDQLASARMVHLPGDNFNPPALTNFLGCVQADVDITGFRALNFPPFGSGNSLTASLFVDGTLFAATGAPITFTWYPDRIEREAEYHGLRIRSTLVLAVGRRAAVQRLRVQDLSGRARDVEVRFGVRGHFARSTKHWGFSPPLEWTNLSEVDQERACVRFRSHPGDVHSQQGCVPAPDQLDARGATYRFHLGAGEEWSCHFVCAVAADEAGASALYDALAADPDREIHHAHDDWDDEIRAVFTPGNTRYGGHLPTLQTADPDLKRIYYMSALGLIYFKRDIPESVHGRAYDTLMPRYWHNVTFIWDYYLSSTAHAMLDPEVMTGYIERWATKDIHRHYGTDLLTGEAVGPWYAVNDYAMVSLITEYLRWTGDMAWLDRSVERDGDAPPSSGLELTMEYATKWRDFRSESGLADYGDIGNLLECVQTYVHEVASLNAANVWSMRTVAELLELRGDSDGGAALRREAGELVQRLQGNYVRGGGYWNTRNPDGTVVPVRHCYDFITVLNSIPDDLDQGQRDEMLAFFQSQLQTPVWMMALAPTDDDAMFSVRPDHQWNGSYPAWPALAVTGLYRIGHEDVAAHWLRGLAATFNQGPLCQGHLVDTVYGTEMGGARKAIADPPYITDWNSSSNGRWLNVVLESIFGIVAGFDGTITATPRLDAFDPAAVLTNVPYQGRLYTVDRDGIREQVAGAV